ncbi:phage holin family protein [Thermodesulfobacteriota bacterium]
MISILASWAILTIAVLIVAHVVPGVKVVDYTAAIIAAAILGIVNATIKPILTFLSIPFIVITLGLFIVVINTLMFWLAGSLVSGVQIRDFWSALYGALIISAVSYVVNHLQGD